MAWQQFGLVVLIGVSLWWQERYGMLTKTGEIKLGEDDSWTLMSKGESQRYRIVQASIHPGYIRFKLRDNRSQARLQLVANDSVKPETYRTLRSWIVQRRFSTADAV